MHTFLVSCFMMAFLIGNGQSWTVVNDGATFLRERIQFHDDTVGWISGSVYAAPNTRNAVMNMTHDGGANWQYFQFDTLEIIESVQFTSPLLGWVAGQPVDPCVNGSGLYTTMDGGLSWSENPFFSCIAVLDITVMDSMAFATTFGNGNDHYISTDLGNSWTTVPFSLSGHELFAARWLNDSTLIGHGASATEFHLYLSINQGSTWTVTANFPGNAFPLNFEVINDSTAAISGGVTHWSADVGLFKKTTDRGQTWQNVSPFTTVDYIPASHFHSTDTSFVVKYRWGTDFELYSSTDGSTFNFLENMTVGGNDLAFQDNYIWTVNNDEVFKRDLHVGFEESSRKRFVKVYPNPTKSVVYFSRQLDEIQLFDISGKLLRSLKNSNQLDLTEYERGTYIVQVKKGYQIQSTKVILTD